MKIKNSRIFIADIHQVVNSTVTEELIQSLNRCDGFGSYNCDDEKVKEGLVVIYFEDRNEYMPVGYLKNLLQYTAAKLSLEAMEGQFLREEPSFLPLNGEKFLKNIQPLFSYPGKTSLTELIGIQKFIEDRNTESLKGGMELM